MEKYKLERKGSKLFNMISISCVEANLKKIAKLCGIETNVTYHMSRHSNYAFPDENKHVAEFILQIGNDLETSKLPFFASFCTTFKERLIITKIAKIICWRKLLTLSLL